MTGAFTPRQLQKSARLLAVTARLLRTQEHTVSGSHQRTAAECMHRIAGVVVVCPKDSIISVSSHKTLPKVTANAVPDRRV